MQCNLMTRVVEIRSFGANGITYALSLSHFILYLLPVPLLLPFFHFFFYGIEGGGRVDSFLFFARLVTLSVGGFAL